MAGQAGNVLSACGTCSTIEPMENDDWRLLLRLVLAQRFEVNAIESALEDAKVLTHGQVLEIRAQAAKTAEAWSRDESADLLKLLLIHSQPGATMTVPLSQETREQLRREIDDQTPQR